MSEFLIKYAAEIASVIAIISFLAPFLRARGINDGKLLNKIGDIKALASKVNNQKSDIIFAIKKIDLTVEKLEHNINESVDRIDKTILAFTEDELYTKMLLGLSQLDDFIQIVEQKDNLIQNLKLEIKEIKKKL